MVIGDVTHFMRDSFVNTRASLFKSTIKWLQPASSYNKTVLEWAECPFVNVYCTINSL